MISQTSLSPINNYDLGNISEYIAKQVNLCDGTTVGIRHIQLSNTLLLHSFFSRLSSKSSFLHFLPVSSEIIDAEDNRFTTLDRSSQMGIVATKRNGEEEQIIGLGLYFMLVPVSRETAEFGLVIEVRTLHDDILQ